MRGIGWPELIDILFMVAFLAIPAGIIVVIVVLLRKRASRATQSKPSATTAAQDLLALADLKDRGILSEKEFAAKKAALLKRM